MKKGRGRGANGKTPKELKKMNREELLELLLAAIDENEALKEENSRLDGSFSSKEASADAGFADRREAAEEALNKRQYRKRYFALLRSTVFALITVAAIAVLITTLWMPVLRIYGASMEPSLKKGQIVLAVKTDDFESGDIVAFQYNSNKILVKRFIAGAGSWVNLDGDGSVYVDGELLDEPYLSKKAYGECDIELPCQVPEARIFVMGDNRETSMDSRSTSVGYVTEEQIVGKVVFCVWPLAEFGFVN